MAVELLNDDMIPPNGRLHRGLLANRKTSKNGAALSRAIFKSHLAAVSELVTSAFPAEAVAAPTSHRSMTVSLPGAIAQTVS